MNPPTYWFFCVECHKVSVFDRRIIGLLYIVFTSFRCITKSSVYVHAKNKNIDSAVFSDQVEILYNRELTFVQY